MTYLHPGSWVASSLFSKHHKTAPWSRSLPISSLLHLWICCCPYLESTTAHSSPIMHVNVQKCNNACFMHPGSCCPVLVFRGITANEGFSKGFGRRQLGWVLVSCTCPAESCNVWLALSDYPCPLKWQKFVKGISHAYLDMNFSQHV